MSYESVIKEDLQSYDVMKNEKYERLTDLKKVLDRIRTEKR